MKFICILLFNLNLILIFSSSLFDFSLIFPFNTIYLKELEDMSIYNESITNSIIRNVFESNIFVSLKIGSPPQKIKLPIYIYSDDFFIARPDADFDRKYPKRNGDYYFNKSLSSTFDFQNGKENEIYYSHPHLSNYVEDNFIFNSSSDLNNELNITKFKFLLASQVKEYNHGVVGLKGIPSAIKREDFLTSVKSYNLTNNYIWYLKYNNLTNGDLIIGNYPHNDKYFKQNCNDCIFQEKHFIKIYTTLTDSRKNPWGLTFKDLLIEYKDEYKSILIDCKKCKIAELNPHLGIIKGSKKYEEIIKGELFLKYINQSICFKDSFTITKNYDEKVYIYYYCKKSIMNNLKNEFNPIIFEHKFFQTNFTLDANDLFFEQNDFIFFKVVFDDYSGFILGAPFISKYPFVFNSDSKEIGFYSKNILNINENTDNTENNENIDNNGDNENDTKNKPNKNNNKNENIYIIIKIIIIIVLGIVLVLIGIFIGKKLFGAKRKIRMNELEDDFEI